MSGRALLRPRAAALALLLIAAVATQCNNARRRPSSAADQAASVAAWETVYRVLQHPRCANCHPAGDLPRQGDDGRPHAQNVQRGPDGMGFYALRCSTCHQQQNLPGRNLPPGAPGWHLPAAATPMPFAGRSPRELGEQLLDPARNGGRTPAQLLEHATNDPLVLWGWNPGDGRTPVPVPHAEFVEALRSWIHHGCGLPEK